MAWFPQVDPGSIPGSRAISGEEGSIPSRSSFFVYYIILIEILNMKATNGFMITPQTVQISGKENLASDSGLTKSDLLKWAS